MDGMINYKVADRVAVITLNRPEKANAQNYPFLYQLNECWERAADDDEVTVIVLQAKGKHFSAGHDLSGTEYPKTDELRSQGKFDLTHHYRYELKHFLGYSLNWRNVPKPSIAAVQGKCIAAGLMLCWPCDLIVAADNAEFSDPVAGGLGIGGVEYHGHTWEFGARKAKELLFTGRTIDAYKAEQIGMVNRVVPLADLENETMALALEIAEQDPFALLQAKRAVNQTLDIMGFQTALQSVFDIHEMGHGAMWSRRSEGESRGSALERMKKRNQEIAQRQRTEAKA